MFDKLAAVEARYVELESMLVSPEVIANRRDFAKLAKERSDIEQIVHSYRAWKELQEQIEGNKSLVHDADEDVRTMALNSGCEGYADLVKQIEGQFIEFTGVASWLAPPK